MTEARKPVTVLVVRHAETAASTKTNRDPELSEAGQARAEALATLLAKSGATHLFSTQYKRTQATLAPLARLVKLEVEIIAAQEAERQITTLKGLPPGSVAIVAGHSNTVPDHVAALGGSVTDLVDSSHGKVLDHDSYDRLFIVTLPTDEGVVAQTIELRY
jgi:phosphohistidine phosphatase SixA